MRWTVDRFWRERQGVAGTNLFTTNDLLRAAFLSGATEAEIDGGGNEVWVRVAGIGLFGRRRLRRQLEEEAVVGITVNVVRLKGPPDGYQDESEKASDLRGR